MSGETCKAITASGESCKRKALDNGYCSLEAHQKLAEPGVCGHENKHYTGDEPLLCELKPGHEGNHTAVLDNNETAWNGMAGVPVEQIEPDLSTLPEHNAKKE